MNDEHSFAQFTFWYVTWPLKLVWGACISLVVIIFFFRVRFLNSYSLYNRIWEKGNGYNGWRCETSITIRHALVVGDDVLDVRAVIVWVKVMTRVVLDVTYSARWILVKPATMSERANCDGFRRISVAWASPVCRWNWRHNDDWNNLNHVIQLRTSLCPFPWSKICIMW